MKKIIAICLVLLMCGCSINNIFNKKSTDVQGTVPENNQDENENNKAFDSLNLALLNFDGFCPHSMSSYDNRQSMSFIYEPLFALDEGLEPYGVLAGDYAVSPDGLTMNITLKDNVYWHDGTKLSPADAAYTINLVVGNYSVYKSPDIASAKAKSGNAISVSFKRKISNPEAALTFPIIKNNSNKYTDVPNGTGPFSFINRNNVDTYSFGLFSMYHGNAPKFSKLNLIVTKSEQSIKQMFDVGETDAIIVDSEMLKSYTARPNSKLIEYNTDELFYLRLNSYKLSKNVRAGILHLIDKEKITKDVFSKSGIFVNYPMSPSYKYCGTGQSDNMLDEKVAESLFNLDGYSLDTLSFSIISDQSDMDIDGLGEQISRGLEKAGASCTLERLSHEEYEQRIKNCDYDVAVSKINLLVNISRMFSEDNYINYYNEELYGLLSKAKPTPEEYNRIFSILLDENPIIPICYKRAAISVSSGVAGNYKPIFNNAYNGFLGQ